MNVTPRAVILAGGKGTRLAPFTATLPKPLVPLGDMPILELVIRQLKRQGVGRVTLTVNHLASLLQAYFGDGTKFGLEIDYALEDQPLGTAGPCVQKPVSRFESLRIQTDLSRFGMG